jgi:ribose transport system substrate-binding protein
MHMKTMGRAVALALAVTMGLAACGSSSSGGDAAAGGKDGKQLFIGLLFPVTSQTPYSTSYVKAFKAKAAKLGVRVKVYDANLSASTQASQADELFAQKPDGVILNPAAADAAAPIIAKANALKIPISISNSEVSPKLLDKAAFYTGPPNKQQGEVAAELLAKALGNKGNVVIVGGPAGVQVVNDREAGLKEKLKEIAPDMKVLDTQPADWDPAKSISVTTSMLTKYGDKVNGIYAMADFMAIGASQALTKAGKDPKDIPIVGTGFSTDGQKNIKDGALYGTVRQSATSDGEYAIDYLVKFLKGEKVKKSTYIPSEAITIDNVDQFTPDWN